MPKIPCTVSLDDALIAELDKYADSLGETRSTVVQRAVREFLKRAAKREAK